MTLSPDARQAKLNELYEYGKSKGALTYKEIMDRLMEMEMDPDQLDKVLETLEALGVVVVNDNDPTATEPEPVMDTVEDFDRGLKCGADKVSVNSGAIRNPQLIEDAARRYGDQCVVLSVDAKRVNGSYHVFAKGGREDTGMDALDWISRGVSMGAGEIVLNSIDTDGVKQGFDLEMLDAVCSIVDVPVIASGGAGCVQDFVTLFKTLPKVDSGLAASIFHFGEVKIGDLKDELARNGINVRRIKETDA